MSSKQPGTGISTVEVTHVSTHGIWLLSGNKELFLPYDAFPWFREIPLNKILNVTELTPGHYYWPDIDVDLGVESIEHPDRFPLSSKEM